MRVKKLVNRTAKKHLHGKCKFCNCNDYESLMLHMILPESKGGKNTDQNTVVCCHNCKKQIHNEQIVLDRQYPSMSGRLVLHYWTGGQEFWE